MSGVVRIMGAADGTATPHDGRFLLNWYPHTRFGTLACDSTDDITKARRFRDFAEAAEEWKTISRVEPKRPTDGAPNRPLSSLTIVFEKAT